MIRLIKCIQKSGKLRNYDKHDLDDTTDIHYAQKYRWFILPVYGADHPLQKSIVKEHYRYGCKESQKIAYPNHPESEFTRISTIDISISVSQKKQCRTCD